MKYKMIATLRGERVSARADGADITVYTANNRCVSRSVIASYQTSPVLCASALFAYCDEIIPLPEGRLAERKGDIIKLKTE